MDTLRNIPYGKQNITDEDIEAVVEALRSDFITQGPRIAEFETAFAAYCGARHAAAVSNGTAALHLCALALGVEPGDGVITTPVTFVASANGFRYCGAKISFCDIDPDTHLMDLAKLENMLAAAPAGTYKGVVIVDFAGYPADVEKLRALADRYGLWIVEDACHSPGGHFTDSKGVEQLCGNSKYADMTVFSFHPVKHITTGEGGMITTGSDDLHEKVLRMRSHGITKDSSMMSRDDGGWYYEMIELGYNYRLTDFQAALGISQLKRAKSGIEKRRSIARRYDEAFSKNPAIKIPAVENGIGHAYHLYVIEIDDRAGLYDYLRANGIYTQVHYIPVHFMPYYEKTGYARGSMPVSEKYYKRCLSLPMFPTLGAEDQEYVIEKVLEFLKK